MAQKLTESDLLKIGFKKIAHFTVGNSLVYNLKRNRHLSFSNIGTFNEMIFICETDDENPQKINDLICIHNYDHDGYMTFVKITQLISFFN